MSMNELGPMMDNNREPWMNDAACRGEDPDIFFSTERSDELKAVRICREECRVAMDCLEYAVKTNQKFGVWGGTPPAERKRIRKRAQERKRRLSKALGLDS